MDIFLRLKHWQLFGLFFIVPIILLLTAIPKIGASSDPIVLLIMLPVIMVLLFGCFFGWLYTIGTNMNKKLPEAVKMNLTKFKWFMIIPVVYLLLVSVYFVEIFVVTANGERPNQVFSAVVLSLHLFSMFCVFYSAYFNAKSLKAIELQRPVTSADYIIEFLLLFFLPIGVWVIQPRINKLFAESLQTTENI